MESGPIAQARELADAIAAGSTEPKVLAYAAALKESLDRAEGQFASLSEERDGLAQAYEKLTAPANRVATFLRPAGEGRAVVVLGDAEYVVELDPALSDVTLGAGDRVRLNEAYAIVGLADPHAAGAMAKVAEQLEDGRIRLADGPEGQDVRIVGCAERLAGAGIKPGDSVLLDPTGRFAIEHFPRTAGKDYFIESVPDMPWENIGGQAAAIAAIREVVEQPMLHPELFRKYGKTPAKGVLLYGPPGCGKTMVGKAIAYNLARIYAEKVGREVRECFLHISGPRILNMWLGETERMVREIFATARARAKEGEVVVIFIDEAESILRTRSSGRALNINNTVVPQFCAEMDGIVGIENVVTVLTSNRPDYIDPAILRPERIDRKVKVGRPDKDASRDILGLYLTPETPLDARLVAAHIEPECARVRLIEAAVEAVWAEGPESEFVQVVYRSGTSRTLHWRDFVSGALLKSVVDRAKDYAIRRAIESGEDGGLREEDVLRAVAQEYRENEIFPKGDAAEDWIRLLDVEPESVVSVRPVARGKPGLEWGGRVS
jgi:proteasome-associated ATPase